MKAVHTVSIGNKQYLTLKGMEQIMKRTKQLKEPKTYGLTPADIAYVFKKARARTKIEGHKISESEIIHRLIEQDRKHSAQVAMMDKATKKATNEKTVEATTPA